MSFNRYTKYKDSGVEWLGEVPEGWEIKPLKRACRVFPSNVDKKSYEGELPVQLCNYTDVYHNEKIVAGMDFMSATAKPDQIDKFTLRAGDTIITKDSETSDDIAIAAYVPEDMPGVICGYHLSMVRPDGGIHGAFMKRLFDSWYAKARFNVLANGLTRVGLGQYALDNIKLPFPPATEQQAIATFLDRETAKIDALVAEQENLIALLKEKRQAVTSHAVTKGLDPTVPMKDSGIEWLGEVPAHWSYGALRRVASRIVVGIAEAATHAYVDVGIPILRSTNIRAGRIIGDILYIDSLFAGERESKLINSKDLLTVRTGNAGVTAVVPPSLDRCQCFTMLITTPTQDANSEYLCYWMNSDPAQTYFGLEGWGTAQTNISVPILKDLPVPIPPKIEQESIVAFLDRETTKLDDLTTEAQHTIDLLKERRSALISAAVTGKIDVRGYHVHSQPIT
ncbi:MAG: restriction endonuclease subunit S [Methylococcaceae bacterium]|jgi:type I restriction enzyme S subunit